MASRPSLDKAAWQQTRAAVRKRDGNACVVCGTEHGLSVHHIVPARQGGSDELDNLVTLCRFHHGLAETWARGRRARELSPNTAERFRDDPRFQDDPERGIYWSFSDLPNSRPQRTSRKW
jgi:5-methylcytosine-specific restriction endonuclease McrA